VLYGVDPGYTRVAVSCPETRELSLIKLDATLDTHERLQTLLHWYSAMVPPDATVVCEAPIVGASGNAQTAVKLAMVVGALASARRTVLAAPSSWKKAVVGHGHASKSDVRAWLTQHHPALAQACGASQDLVDACCVGFYGHGLASEGLLQEHPGHRLLRAGGGPAHDEGGGGLGPGGLRELPCAACLLG
jgi:Holliday junction resolvasome RuvABC endonuclease subunit